MAITPEAGTGVGPARLSPETHILPTSQEQFRWLILGKEVAAQGWTFPCRVDLLHWSIRVPQWEIFLPNSRVTNRPSIDVLRTENLGTTRSFWQAPFPFYLGECH